ncbi:MAG: MFS transporter [Ignavibacteriales bacterium]|nr:MFS transporter [Ignavibacteriales bacterium]
MHSKRTILIVASVAAFITPYVGSAINVALPSIGREFSADVVELSWVALSFLLASAVSLVPIGRLADIYGRRPIFLSGMALFSLASLLAGFSTSLGFLIAMRIFQGIGGSMMFGTGMAIVLSVYPPAERGTALGFNVAAVYLGLSIGPILGGFLIQAFGWRSLFFSNLPLGLLVLILAFWILPKDATGTRREPLDLQGAALFSTSLILGLYGLSHSPSVPGIVCTLCGIVFCLLFVRQEFSTAHPMMDMRLFRRNIVFLYSNLAALINYSATAAVGFLLSMYLQYAKGLSPRQAGMVMISQPIAMALVSPFAGKISDTIEPRIVASLGMALTAVSLAFFASFTIDASISSVVICSAILGLGFALFSSPNTNAVMSAVPKQHYGMASGIIGTMRLVGQMVSMAIAAIVINLNIGRMQIGPQNLPGFVTSMQQVFLICCAMCVAGIFASLARGKLRK